MSTGLGPNPEPVEAKNPRTASDNGKEEKAAGFRGSPGGFHKSIHHNPRAFGASPFVKGELLSSKTELQRELQRPPVVEGIGDLAEVRIHQIAPGLGKLRRVEQVD